MNKKVKFRRLILKLTLTIFVLLVGVILISDLHDTAKDGSAPRSLSSNRLKAPSLSSSPDGYQIRSSRIVKKSLVATSDHPRVKLVLKTVREFEARRTKITFDSNIDGRRNIFMEVARPTDNELGAIREMVSALSELRVMPDGSKTRWATFISEQFYLREPTSYIIRIGETRDGGYFTYGISPLGESEYPILHGSVKVDTILNEALPWRLSHLISIGEATSPEGSIKE